MKICAITAGIKKTKKKKKYDSIVLLGKDKLNTIEILISQALLNLYITHDEFVSVHNMLREYYQMKENIKNPKNFREMHCIKVMAIYSVSCKKYTANENSRVRKTKRNSLVLLSNCAISGKKKTTFIKNSTTSMINLK